MVSLGGTVSSSVYRREPERSELKRIKCVGSLYKHPPRYLMEMQTKGRDHGVM